MPIFLQLLVAMVRCANLEQPLNERINECNYIEATKRQEEDRWQRS